VYIEANACGTPVLGRERGGVREAIRDGVTGFLVSNQAQCNQVLATRRYRELKQDDMLDWAETFGLESTAQKLRMLVNEVASTESSDRS